MALIEKGSACMPKKTSPPIGPWDATVPRSCQRARRAHALQCGSAGYRGFGTALGVIRAAVEQGKRFTCSRTRRGLSSRLAFNGMGVDERWNSHDRDLRQHGGRDDAAGKIGAIVVGADRIAANAMWRIRSAHIQWLCSPKSMAFRSTLPRLFHVDLACPDGSQIPIEQRNAREVTHIAGSRWFRMASVLRILRSTSLRRNTLLRSLRRRVWRNTVCRISEKSLPQKRDW